MEKKITKKDAQDIIDIVNQVAIRGSQAERIVEIKKKLELIASDAS